MRGPVHGTKDARKVAIDSSVGAVTETYDFIWFGTAAAVYFGHALVPGASPIACALASFATLGVWGNLDTLVNNAAIITINDLEHQRHGFSGLPATPVGGPSPNWRPGLPVAAISGTELLAGRDKATRHAHRQTWASAIDRSRYPSHSARPGHQLHDAKTNSTALDRMSLSGAILRPAGAAMRTRSRRRAAPPGPRHTDTAAPPCAATASPLTIASEYIVDNRSVPS